MAGSRGPAQAPEREAAVARLEFDRVEKDAVHFKAPQGTPAPRPVSTGLSDLRYLGSLWPESGSPYFLFKAKPCQDCAHDLGIYAIRPEGGRATAFVHPGKVLDPKTRNVLLDSRAFFGRCLTGRGDVYVSFQKERLDRKRGLITSVYIAEAGSERFSERLIERRGPRINEALRRVKDRECVEIEGRNRLMLSKPLDLTPRAGDGDADDDAPEPDDSDKGKADPAQASG
jgi:hypothetical protein